MSTILKYGAVYEVVILQIKNGCKGEGQQVPTLPLASHNVTWCQEEADKIEVLVDTRWALLNPDTLTVKTVDNGLQHLVVSAAAKRLQNSWKHVSLRTNSLMYACILLYCIAYTAL